MPQPGVQLEFQCRSLRSWHISMTAMPFIKNAICDSLALEASKWILHNTSLVYSLASANFWSDMFHQTGLVRSTLQFLEGWLSSWLKTAVQSDPGKGEEHQTLTGTLNKGVEGKKTFTGSGYTLILVHR